MAPTKFIGGADSLHAVADLEKKMEDCMKVFEGRLNEATSTQATPTPLIQQIYDDFRHFKSFMCDAVNLLRTQISAVACAVEDLESRSRRKFLVFRGISDVINEEPVSLVCGTVAKLMKGAVKLSECDIKFCYRQGKPTKEMTGPRPILVKFVSKDIRNSIWHAKVQLKGSNVSVAEFLTNTRRSLLNAARTAFGMKKCWSQDGNIFVKLPNESKQRLTSTSQLSELIKQSGHKPVAEHTHTEGKRRAARNVKPKT